MALKRLDLVKDYYEAFYKYLSDNGPAYERKIHVSPQSALKLINDAGGLSFIAHPGHMKESILHNLINAGIDGIEVVHPSHNNYQVKFYRGIVNQYCLLESGDPISTAVTKEIQFISEIILSLPQKLR